MDRASFPNLAHLRPIASAGRAHLLHRCDQGGCLHRGRGQHRLVCRVVASLVASPPARGLVKNRSTREFAAICLRAPSHLRNSPSPKSALAPETIRRVPRKRVDPAVSVCDIRPTTRTLMIIALRFSLKACPRSRSASFGMIWYLSRERDELARLHSGSLSSEPPPSSKPSPKPVRNG